MGANVNRRYTMSEIKWPKPDHSYLKPYEVNLFVEWVMRQWNADDRARFGAEFPALYNKLVGDEVFKVYNCKTEAEPARTGMGVFCEGDDDPRWDEVIRLTQERGFIYGVKVARETFMMPLRDAKEHLEQQLQRRDISKDGLPPTGSFSYRVKSTEP